jgi:hypothetical protein
MGHTDWDSASPTRETRLIFIRFILDGFGVQFNLFWGSRHDGLWMADMNSLLSISIYRFSANIVPIDLGPNLS